MSRITRSLAFVGATLFDGTGKPAIKDSVIMTNDDEIILVGKKNQVNIPEKTTIIDLTGKSVIPGLIDSHLHFLDMGIQMIRTVDLSNTTSIKEVQAILKEKIEGIKIDEWVLGNEWDESKWEENRYINKWDLDDFSPNNPIVLTRICGHMVTLNSKAMEVAGITKNISDPHGGQVDRNIEGELTGVLRDARNLIDPFLPEITLDLALEGLKKANEYALGLGCTGFHDAGLDEFGITVYQSAIEKGFLQVRVNIIWQVNLDELINNYRINSKIDSKMLRLGPAKILLDGSIGARTAALYEDYQDEPSSKGLLLIQEEELFDVVENVHKKGIQIAIHAIGDYGIDLAINAIESALKRSPRKNHRHRIEHCELLSTDQIERINRLGIVASMQPNFVGQWGGSEGMYESRLGKRRLRQMNPFRLILDEGVRITFGSDGMPFNPLYGIHWAVNHHNKGSRITLEEAIKAYTLDAAFASFEENIKGSIEPGKLADFTVLENDLSETPMDKIKNTKVCMTIINGNILFDSR